MLTITYKNETLPIAQWAKRLGVHRETIHNRLRLGWTPEKALTEPVCSAVNGNKAFSKTDAERILDDTPRDQFPPKLAKLIKHYDGPVPGRYARKHFPEAFNRWFDDYCARNAGPKKDPVPQSVS